MSFPFDRSHESFRIARPISKIRKSRNLRNDCELHSKSQSISCSSFRELRTWISTMFRRTLAIDSFPSSSFITSSSISRRSLSTNMDPSLISIDCRRNILVEITETLEISHVNEYRSFWSHVREKNKWINLVIYQSRSFEVVKRLLVFYSFLFWKDEQWIWWYSEWWSFVLKRFFL